MVSNRKCNYCGSEYYVCRSCVEISSWKNVCCSKECFMKLIGDMPDNVRPIKIDGGGIMSKVILRGQLKSGFTVDVIGYDIELGKFDTFNNKTYTLNDFSFFYIAPNELKDMAEKIKEQCEKRAKADKSQAKKEMAQPEKK